MLELDMRHRTWNEDDVFRTITHKLIGDIDVTAKSVTCLRQGKITHLSCPSERQQSILVRWVDRIKLTPSFLRQIHYLSVWPFHLSSAAHKGPVFPSRSTD